MSTQHFVIDSSGGISGSLTNLADGTSYLVAGDGIQLTSQSNGSVLIASQPGAFPPIVVYRTGSFTSVVSQVTVDPVLCITASANTTWGLTWHLPHSWDSYSVTNYMSVSAPSGSTGTWSAGFMDPGNGAFNTLDTPVGSQVAVSSPGYVGLGVIVAFVAVGSTPGPITLAYGQSGGGTATSYGGGNVVAQRLS